MWGAMRVWQHDWVVFADHRSVASHAHRIGHHGHILPLLMAGGARHTRAFVDIVDRLPVCRRHRNDRAE